MTRFSLLVRLAGSKAGVRITSMVPGRPNVRDVQLRGRPLKPLYTTGRGRPRQLQRPVSRQARRRQHTSLPGRRLNGFHVFNDEAQTPDEARSTLGGTSESNGCELPSTFEMIKMNGDARERQ